MSLLDDDKKVLSQYKKKKSGRKLSSSGINRFKGLNKFDNLTDKYRQKNEAKKDERPADSKNVVNEDRLKQTLNVELETKQKTEPESKATNQNNLNEQKQVIKNKKIKSKQSSNEVQSEYKQGSIRDQSEINQSTNREQTESLKVSEQSSDQSSKSKQSSTLINTSTLDISLLNGLQKEVLRVIYLISKQHGTRVVGPITRDQIAQLLNKHKENIKTVIYRLCKKGFLLRAGGKEGRGGFLKLEIPQMIYHQLSQEESLSDQVRTFDLNQLSSNQSSQLSSNGSSSSSSFLFNKNTTANGSPVEKEILPNDWLEIQIPDNLKELGMGGAQLRQIYKLGEFKLEDVVDSLEHFSYDLENGHVKAHKPLNYLMSVLMRYKANYTSKALVDEMKAFREEQERLKREYHELQSEKYEIDADAKFKQFWESKSRAEKDEYLSPNQLVQSGSELQTRLAKAKFFDS